MTALQVLLRLRRRAARSPDPATDVDVEEAENADRFEQVMDRRRVWAAAPVEIRTAVADRILTAEMVSVTRRRRRWAAATALATAPAAAVATTAHPLPAMWVLYAAAMGLALGRNLMRRYAPYRPVGELFDRVAWAGVLDSGFVKRSLAAEPDEPIHRAQLVPTPANIDAHHLTETLAGAVVLDDLPAHLAAAEPWRAVTTPRIDQTAPGLAAAVYALAATSHYASRPLAEVVAVTCRTYLRPTASSAAVTASSGSPLTM